MKFSNQFFTFIKSLETFWKLKIFEPSQSPVKVETFQYNTRKCNGCAHVLLTHGAITEWIQCPKTT